MSSTHQYGCENSIGSMSAFVRLVWRHKLIYLHRGLDHPVNNNIFDYLRAVVYKLYSSIVPTSHNSIVPTSWRVRIVQYIRLTTSTVVYPNTCKHRRRCSRVSLLLPLTSSSRFSISSGYEMQVQGIMEERHWAYLALFLAKPSDLCDSVLLLAFEA